MDRPSPSPCRWVYDGPWIDPVRGVRDGEEKAIEAREGGGPGAGRQGLEPGAGVWGRYRILEQLGEGAFGAVFSAFDEGVLQRRVALKVLRRGASADGEVSAALLQEFQLEARITGGLAHPHIARVYDAGAWNGHLVMVQELIDGVDLDRFLADHAPLDPDFVLRLARQLCDGLAFAHRSGVFHRDIKPGNLLIDAHHQLKIVDFGLASSLHLEAAGGSAAAGTPGYAAPEQLRRGPVDARTDLFSAACVIYLLLTGRPPFVGRTAPELLRQTLRHDPPPPSSLRPGLPTGLDRVLARALRKEATDRYPDLERFAEELEHHARFAVIEQGADALAALGEAVRERRCVLVIGAVPGAPEAAGSRSFLARAVQIPWPLVVTAGYEAAFAEAIERAHLPSRPVIDPGQEPGPGGGVIELRIFPAIDPGDEPAMEFDALWTRLDRLMDATDTLRAILATSALLFVGPFPGEPLLRQLHAQLTRLRPSGTRDCFLVGRDFSLAEVRWAERKGMRLVERPPLELLAELAAEPATVEAWGGAPVALPDRPYKFLHYFDPGDECIFFGREVERQHLLNRILARPVTVLYGASGAGKTSLVRAGLIPRLERAGQRAVYARLLEDPWAELAQAIAGERSSTPAREEMPRWLAARAKEERLLVVFIDQLEELFTRFSRELRRAFVAALKGGLEASGGRMRLVFSIRADHLARLAGLSDLFPGLLEQGYYLEPLSEAQAREAIEAPAKLLGIEVDPALVDQLVEDLARDGIDPPQLQLVCDALFDRLEAPSRRLTLRAYQALGGVRTLLTRHLERVLSALTAEEGNQLRDVLKAMVTSADLKSARRPGELARRAGLSEPVLQRWIDLLIARRLVRPLQREGAVWYELAHEFLVGEIAGWLSQEDREMQTVREMLEMGLRSYRRLGVLLSRSQLRLVEAHRHRLELDEEQTAFLEACLAATRRSRRRWIAGLAALLTLTLLGIVAGRYTVLSRSTFARAPERALRWNRWDQPKESTVSGIDIYRGAPDAWPIDPWLGFPDRVYETDFNLEQVEPSRRDAVRAGLALDPSRPVQDQLLALMTPVAQVHQLASAGRIDAAMQRLATLAGDSRIDPSRLLALMPVFALAPEMPPGLARLALDLGARQVKIEAVQGVGFPKRGAVGEPLGLLFHRAPRDSWQDLLEARGREDAFLRTVVDVLDHVGVDADAGVVTRAMEVGSMATSEAAFVALSNMGACSALPTMRAQLHRPGAGLLNLQSSARFLGDCGTPADLPWLEQVLTRLLRAPDDVSSHYSLALVLAATRRISPAAGVAMLDRLLRERLLPEARNLVLSRLPNATDPGLLEVLRGFYAGADPATIPVEVHAAWAYHGDAGHVPPLWQAAMGRVQDPGIMALLWGVTLYRDPWIRDRFLELVRRERPPTHVYFPLLEALRWYEDEAVLRVLVGALADQDRLVVQAATDLLPELRRDAVRPLLEQGLSSPNPLMRLNAARVLQRMDGEARGALFHDFLAGEAGSSATYLELYSAVRGLTVALLEEPAEEALKILRHRNRHIRMAAIAALMQHEDQETVHRGVTEAVRSPDEWLRLAGDRVRWALSAREQEEALHQEIDEALSSRHYRRALQLLTLMRSGNGYDATLERVLAPQLPGAMPDLDWLVLGQVAAQLHTGEGTPMHWLQAYVSRAMRAGLSEDARFAEVRDHYTFRVIAGLEPPKGLVDPPRP